MNDKTNSINFWQESHSAHLDSDWRRRADHRATEKKKGALCSEALGWLLRTLWEAQERFLEVLQVGDSVWLSPESPKNLQCQDILFFLHLNKRKPPSSAHTEEGRGGGGEAEEGGGRVRERTPFYRPNHTSISVM